MLATSDEGSVRIYRSSDDNAAEYIEPQHFLTEQQMLENFWELEGNTLFHPQALRKAFNTSDEDEADLVFWRMELNPALKVRFSLI